MPTRNLYRIILIVFLLSIIVCYGCKQSETQHPANIQKLITTNTATSLDEAATLYEYGDGVSENIIEAARLYYKAAQKGNYHSHYSIWRLQDRLESLKNKSPFEWEQYAESKKEALSGYTRLLMKHPEDPEIYYRLGLLYADGFGEDTQGNRTSREMMTKAAGMGHKDAVDYLANLNQAEQQLKWEIKEGK